MKLIVGATALLCLASVATALRADNNRVLMEEGEYCVSGFVMDKLCIDLGNLLDNRNVKTLEHPELHSIHCLVDVQSCVSSGYHILIKNDGDDLYHQDVQLDGPGNDMVVELARTIGTGCYTCYGKGDQEDGMAATVIGTLDDSMDPPLLKVRELLPAETPCPVVVDEPVASFCFAADTMEVNVQEQGATLMKDLKLGEKVETLSGKFEPIYSFGHKYASTTTTEFVQLVTSEKKKLELTRDHMVFLRDGSAVPASLLAIGDSLHGGQVVMALKTVRRKGIMSPFTESGTIVVNGVAASTFVAFSNSKYVQVGTHETSVSYQWIAHAFEAPHRMYCKHVAKNGCLDERYTSDGVSMWVAAPLDWVKWLMEQHALVVALCLIPSVLIMGALIGVEMLLAANTVLMCAGAIAILVSTRCIRGSKRI